MAKPIIDIKGADWTKGISAKQALPVGGLFSAMSHADPFDSSGVVKPSYVPDSVTPSASIKFLTNFNTSGTGYLYGHGDSGTFYQVLGASPYTQTDKSAFLNATAGTIWGATTWASTADQQYGYVYAKSGGNPNGGIRFIGLPVDTGTDIIISASINDSNMDVKAMCVGPYNNTLYVADNPGLLLITRTNGTTGNTTHRWVSGDARVRDITTDGKYLIIASDNNAIANASRIAGNYSCKIRFWDEVKIDASSFIVPDYNYDVPGESYISAIRFYQGRVYIFGDKGIHVCSAGNAPVLLRTYSGGNTVPFGVPTNPYQVVINGGVLYWVDGAGSQARSGEIYAYGNPHGGQKIFYMPYSYTAHPTQTQNCLTPSGSNLWVSGTQPIIYIHNATATAGTATVKTIDYAMEGTYNFEYASVVLREPMSSGMSVRFIASKQNDGATITDETKSYSATNPRQSLKFRVKPSGGSNSLFENIRCTVVLTGGATLQRLTVYATPTNDSDESI